MCVDVVVLFVVVRLLCVVVLVGVLGVVVLFLEDVTYLLSISIFLPSDYYR